MWNHQKYPTLSRKGHELRGCFTMIHTFRTLNNLLDGAFPHIQGVPNLFITLPLGELGQDTMFTLGEGHMGFTMDLVISRVPQRGRRVRLDRASPRIIQII